MLRGLCDGQEAIKELRKAVDDALQRAKAERVFFSREERFC